MNYEIRITKITVVPEGEHIFSDRSTDITIVDEASGEFIEVEQHLEGYGKIGINPEEWPTIRAAIDKMVKECKEDK